MSYSKAYSFNKVNWAFHCEDKGVLEDLNVDFYHYESQDSSQPNFEIYIQKSVDNRIPSEFYFRGRNYQFSIGWKKRRFKFDEGLTGFESIGRNRVLTVTGTNNFRLREVVLSYVNSVLGELCDLNGWHRLHASGICNKSSNLAGIAIPLNSGNGKSSFTFWVANNTSAQILSDETLFTNGNLVKGFITRFALRSLPTCPYETYRRHGHEVKYLVEVKTERLLRAEVPFYLWLPKNKWSKFKFLCTFIFGLGNAQMIEFMIRPDNITGLIRIFFSRLVAGFSIIKLIRSRSEWSPSEKDNFETVENLSIT